MGKEKKIDVRSLMSSKRTKRKIKQRLCTSYSCLDPGSILLGLISLVTSHLTYGDEVGTLAHGKGGNCSVNSKLMRDNLPILLKGSQLQG